MIILFLVIFDVFVWGRVIFSKPIEDSEIYFLDVGQGDSELVILPNNVKVLIDGGPNSRLLSQLDSILKPFDRYFDLVVLSHSQTDHFNGLVDVLKRYQVGAFIFNGRNGTASSWQELIKAVEENKVPVIILAAGDKIDYLNSRFNFLLPDRNLIQSSDLNETTLVALLKTQGAKVLFTGDIGAEAENYLIQRYDLDVDVLKVAHHGSKYSSSAGFLSEILPKVAVIEVGKNSYGHPTAGVLNRLASVGAQIFRTDNDGTIKLEIKNKEINVFKAK